MSAWSRGRYKSGRSSIGIDTSFPASTPTRVGQPKLQYRPPRKANRYRRKSSAVANSSEGNRPLEQWDACNLTARVAGVNRFRKSSPRGNAFKIYWSPINKNSKIANHLDRFESRNVTHAYATICLTIEVIYNLTPEHIRDLLGRLAKMGV